jgi:hypothetical protein
MPSKTNGDGPFHNLPLRDLRAHNEAPSTIAITTNTVHPSSTDRNNTMRTHTPESDPGMLYFGGLDLPPTIQDIPLAYRRAALDWVDMIHQQDGVLKLANLLATLAGVMK